MARFDIIFALEKAYAKFLPFADWLRSESSLIDASDSKLVKQFAGVVSSDSDFPADGTFAEYEEYLRTHGGTEDLIVGVNVLAVCLSLCVVSISPHPTLI